MTRRDEGREGGGEWRESKREEAELVEGRQVTLKVWDMWTRREREGGCCTGGKGRVQVSSVLRVVSWVVVRKRGCTSELVLEPGGSGMFRVVGVVSSDQLRRDNWRR